MSGNTFGHNQFWYAVMVGQILMGVNDGI